MWAVEHALCLLDNFCPSADLLLIFRLAWRLLASAHEQWELDDASS
jgi:hypothetical protein